MARDTTPESLFGTTVTGRDGETIGKVEEVYLDDATGRLEWVSVETGLFGSNVSLVPLERAELAGDVLTVPFDEAHVKDAPNHDPGRELSVDDESELYAYYGSGGYASGSGTTGGTDRQTTGTTGTTGTTTSGSGIAGGPGSAATDRDRDDRTDRDDLAAAAGRQSAGADVRGQGRDTSGPTTDDAMTRSKEELRVGTETREAGRARLRKHIVSENVTRTVPISHEEVVVTREPITDDNRGDALSGGDLTEEEHEVVLTEERAVAEKDVVPVERVQLGTEEVEGTETVQAEVREEKIDLDADSGVGTGTGRERGTRD